jgi:hypothetical protein
MKPKLIEFDVYSGFGVPPLKISINPATIVCIRPDRDPEAGVTMCKIQINCLPYEFRVLHTYETVRDWIQQL